MNTDAYGFITNLRQGGCDPQGAVAVVLGAGGAARAVVAGLVEAGAVEILICNRNEARAVALVTSHQSPVSSHPWHDRHAVLSRATLLINTTSLGMKGQPALELNLDALPTDAFVTDIVYNPLETPLLEAARQRGNPTVDGLGMLLYQGQKAFEYFYGVLPEVNQKLKDFMLA
jgi:shikimate dehydrogenase